MTKAKNKKGATDRGARLKLRVPRRLLVFETTGFALYGVVARCGLGGALSLSAPARSASTDFATAVGEVLEQLRKQSKRRLPKLAVLVSPSATGELLRLPVDPKRPKPRAQMRELVRWEFEEIFVRQNDIWSVGALLQGRGHLSAEGRRELENSAAASSRDQGSAGDLYRKAVGREPYEECLALQESLASMDDELVIGWSPLSPVAEEGRFSWYCAGTGDGLRARWVEAFKKHGVFCSGIYPQLGAALPLLESGPEGRLLVDIRQEQFGLFQLAQGRLDSLAVRACARGTAEPETVAAAVAKFIHPETRVACLNAPRENLEALFAALKQALPGVELRALAGDRQPEPADAERGCPAPVLASLEGAARHALRLCGPELLVRIEAQPPRPPVWKSPEFWPWAIIVLLAVAVGATETTLRVLGSRKQWELDKLDIEYERQLHIKNEAQKTQSEVKRLEGLLAEKEKELAEKQRRMDLSNNVILYRQQLVPGILEAVSEAVPDDVMVDLLEENVDRSGFYLEGWALRNLDGQRFGNLLNDKLAPWNYKVGDIRISSGKGRQGNEGFVLKIRLTKTADAAGKAKRNE